MGIFKIHLLKLIPAIAFILLSYLTNGQNQLDGLWKSKYVTSYSSTDSGIYYTRIFLDINGSNVTLKNFDGIFKEKEIFTNTGTIDQEKNTLIFNQNTDKEKVYPITVEKDYLKFNMNENPTEEITLKKLDSFYLEGNKRELEDLLINNFISGDFSYYDESMGIEFSADSSMLVTSSLNNYLSILDKWALVSFGNELFLYLSDYGPMVHITDFTGKQITFFDEYDTIYNGVFSAIEPIMVATKEQFLGIWEQEKPDTTGFSRFPPKMYDKDFYPNETWEFTNKKAVKYYTFFTRDTEWETSRNGEILFLRSTNDIRFRILSVDDSKLVVERRDIYGDVYEDTFLRKKSVPKPTTLGKYLK